MKSRFAQPVRIPNTTSRKTQPMTTNFAKGIKTYKPNDLMEHDELRLAQDARFDVIGKYKTRRGAELFVDAIGKEATVENWSDDELTDVPASYDKVIKTKFTTIDAFRLWSVNLNIKRGVGALGVLSVAIYRSENNTPTERIAISTFKPAEISDEYKELEARFINAPDLAAETEYFIVVRAQRDCVGEYDIQVSNNLTSNTMVSADGGELWTAVDGDMMYRLNSAPAGTVHSIFVANVGGSYTTLFCFNNLLYRSDQAGNITLIRTLPSGVKRVRFSQDLDEIRYADGVEKPHKINTTTWADSEISTAIAPASHVLSRFASMHYVNANETTQAFWTWEYGHDENYTMDNFSTNFFQHFPSPKTGDPIRAIIDLGGVMYIFTRFKKYQLYNQDLEVWTQGQSSAQSGTFSQESVVSDTNYAYFASDDGVFVFDGTSESNLTKDTIQDVYDAIPDKESITLDIHDSRLFVFYSDRLDKSNNKCLVRNLNLNLWESFDTDTYIDGTCAKKNRMDTFLQGSSRVCALFYGESLDNDYDNVGAPLDFQLATAFQHFGSPAQLKRISKWRPEFDLNPDGLRYRVDCGFAYDFSDKVNYAFDIDLSTSGIRWDEGHLWDNGEIWGGEQFGTRMTTKPSVWNEWRRCQLWYRHFAAHEPVAFEAHTLTVQTQRIR